MKKVISGIIYDSNEAKDVCRLVETKKIGIEGFAVPAELVLTLMRMQQPKKGMLPHETVKRSSFDSNWYVSDCDKLEATGAFFFAVSIGRYGNTLGIVPASLDEARQFAEEHADFDEYVRYFGRPDGYDSEEAKKVAKAIDEANDARDAAKRDLKTKTEELATTVTKLADANDIIDRRDRDLKSLSEEVDKRDAELSGLNMTLNSRNSEIAALNEKISLLNAELKDLRVVQESPTPTAQQEPDAPRKVMESPVPVRHKKGDL